MTKQTKRQQRPASLQSRAKARYVLIMFGDVTAWKNSLIRCVTEWYIFHSHHGPGWNRSSCERCFSARSERLQIYKLVGNIFVSASFVLWARNHWRDKRGMKFSTRLLTFQVLPVKSQYWSLTKTVYLACVPSIYIKWRLSRSMYHVNDSNTVFLPFKISFRFSR